jgi:hypothetical protein
MASPWEKQWQLTDYLLEGLEKHEQKPLKMDRVEFVMVKLVTAMLKLLIIA